MGKGKGLCFGGGREGGMDGAAGRFTERASVSTYY